jgi:hypothetical protein
MGGQQRIKEKGGSGVAVLCRTAQRRSPEVLKTFLKEQTR